MADDKKLRVLRPRKGGKVGDVARGLVRGLVQVPEALAGVGEATGEQLGRGLLGPENLRVLRPRPPSFPGSTTLGRGARAAGRGAGALREGITGFAEEHFGGQGLAYQTGQGIGSSLGIAATSVAGTALGIPPLASAAGLGSIIGAASSYQEALQSFEHPESEQAKDAAMRAFLTGAAIGTTEAVPIAGQVGRFLGRADRASGGLLRRAILSAAAEAGEELAQENVQSVLTDVAAKYVSQHDQERDVLGKLLERWQSGEAWLPPVVAGGLVSALASAGGAARGPKNLPQGSEGQSKPKSGKSVPAAPLRSVPVEPAGPPTETARRVAARWLGEQGAVGTVVPPRTPRQRRAAEFFRQRGAEAVFVETREELAAPGGYAEGVAVFDAAIPGRVLERRLVLHEAQHHLRQLVKQEEETFVGLASELEGALATLDPVGMQKTEAKVREAYAQRGLDEAGIADEVVSNYLENFGALLFEDARFQEALQQPGLGRRLLDAIIRLVQKAGVKLETSVTRKLRQLRDQLAETDLEAEVDPKVIPAITGTVRKVFDQLAELSVPRETSQQQLDEALPEETEALRVVPGAPQAGGERMVRGVREPVQPGLAQPAPVDVPAGRGARAQAVSEPAGAVRGRRGAVRKAGAAVPGPARAAGAKAPAGEAGRNLAVSAAFARARGEQRGAAREPAAAARPATRAEAKRLKREQVAREQARAAEKKRRGVEVAIQRARKAGKTDVAQRLERQLAKMPRPARPETTRRAQPSARELVVEAAERGEREPARAKRTRVPKEQDIRFSISREHFEEKRNPLPIPKDAAALLGRKQKRKKGVGEPKNARTEFKLRNGRTFVVGWKKPADWLRNVEAAGLTPEEMKRARFWYEGAREVFAETGDAWPNFVTAWLLANKNVDVSGATLNALRGREHTLAPSVGPKAGLSEETMYKFWSFVEKGKGSLEGLEVGQKLYDFVDSAMLRERRQWMGNKPAAGSPFVVDVHSLRDMGYVDEALVAWLERNVVPEQLAEVNALKLDTRGAPNEVQYERAAERGLAVTRFLKESGNLGRGWRSWQVQALGWVAMQKRIGAAMGFVDLTLPSQTRTVPFEVLPGTGTKRAALLAKRAPLDLEQTRRLTRAVSEVALARVLPIVGSPPVLSHTEGNGGWMDSVAPAVVLRVASSPEAAEDLAAALAYVLEQTEVGVARPLRPTKSGAIPSQANSWFVHVRGDSLLDDAGRARAWAGLRQELPEVAQGFTPTHDGLFIAVSGIRKYAGATGFERLRGEIEAKLGALEAHIEGDVKVDVLPGRWDRSTNDWTKHPDGQDHLQRLGSRYGPQVRRVLDRARAEADRRFRAELRELDRPAPAAAVSAPEPELLRARTAGEVEPVRFSLGSSWRRQWTAEAGLPRAVFDSKIARDGWINAHMQRARDLDADFRKAVRAVYGARPTAAELEAIDRAFKSQVQRMGWQPGPVGPSSLPQPLADAVQRMRDHVKELSLHLIQSGAIEAELIPTVLANLDFYATRSYRVFDDPDWAERVPIAIRNKAKAFLRMSYPNDTPNQIERRINAMLFEGKAAQSPIAVLARGSKLGSKDLSITKRRETIAPEIRALFGEYKDVRVNYARSVAKMAFLVGNHKFLDEVRSKGLGQFLWEKSDPNVPAEAKVTIAADESSVLYPLNGLVTTVEVEQAFRDYAEREQLPMWAQFWLAVNGIAKYGKTVGSVMTHLRNWSGNIPFALAQGHWRVRRLVQSVKTLATTFHRMNDPAMRAYYEKALRLGVIHESATASELRAVLEDVWTSGRAVWDPTSASGRARRALDFMTRLYQAGDDFWKVYAWENEKARYRKTGLFKTEAELEAHTARIVRNTYPTYSMVPRAIRKLRRFPILGTFVSFPWEVMRTSKNTLLLIREELKSSNGKVRTIGAQRLVGTIAAASWTAAFTAFARALLGMSDDEDEAAREVLPEWNKNSDLLWLGEGEDGNRIFVDLSYTDPYKYLKAPLLALMRGEDWEEKITRSGKALLEPFMSEELATRAAIDLMRNTTADGRRIWNPSAPLVNQARDALEHVGRSIEPGTVTSLRRIYMGTQGKVVGTKAYDPRIETLAMTTGVRVSTLDLVQGVTNKAYDFAEESSNATSLLSSVAGRRGTVTDEEIEEAYEDAEAVRSRAWRRLQRSISAARALGQRDAAIYGRLAAVLGQDRARAALRGLYERYRPGAAFLATQARGASPDERRELLRRAGVVRRLSVENGD